MKLIPSVTMDVNQFHKWTGMTHHPNSSPSIKGLYFHGGYIWIRRRSFEALAHEFIHHVFWLLGEGNSGSRRLFFDIFNYIFDCVYHYFRFPETRKHKGMMMEMMRESVADWLDFILCREVD